MISEYVSRAIVAVTMIPKQDGGRSPLTGGTYRPTVKEKQRDASVYWSLGLKLAASDEDGTWYATAQFLSDQAPADLLKPNNELLIYEGATPVGRIRVLVPPTATKALLSLDL